MKSKKKAVNMGHKTKLMNLQKRQCNYKENANIHFQKIVIDNFSS